MAYRRPSLSLQRFTRVFAINIWNKTKCGVIGKGVGKRVRGICVAWNKELVVVNCMKMEDKSSAQPPSIFINRFTTLQSRDI